MSQTAISISQDINSRKITYFENVFVFLPTLNTDLLILESENISLVITHEPLRVPQSFPAVVVPSVCGWEP